MGAYVWRNPPPEDLPEYTALPESFAEGKDFKLHCEISLDVPVEHGLLIENLLDLAHAPFTHTETFAKGWSIPDLVNFQTLSRLGGNWEPYPHRHVLLPPLRDPVDHRSGAPGPGRGGPAGGHVPQPPAPDALLPPRGPRAHAAPTRRRSSVSSTRPPQI